MPCDLDDFEMCDPSYYSESMPGASCLEVYGGSLRRSHGNRATPKAAMEFRHACRSTESQGKRFQFLLDNMALVLGASKCRGSTPNLNHTSREIYIISLATFTVLSVDGLHQKITQQTSHLVQSVTDRACIPMLTIAGFLQRSQLLTRSSLSSSQPKPHELPVRKRKLGNGSRSCAGVADQSRRRVETGPK